MEVTTKNPAKASFRGKDRFELISELVNVHATLLQLAYTPARKSEEDEHAFFLAEASLMTEVTRIGDAWARSDTLDAKPVVPSLLTGFDYVYGFDDVYDGDGMTVIDAFLAGYRSANRGACYLPLPRCRDEPPAQVFYEDAYFWVGSCPIGLTVVSKNVAGGFGSVDLAPRIVDDVFRALTRAPMDVTRWYNSDPYGMNGPEQLLLRDDLHAGWDRDADWNPDDRDSETLGELFLEVAHPGSGRLYFGARGQQENQLSAFLALRDTVGRLFEELNSPQRRAEAEARAAIIHSRTDRCFLPADGYCFSCDADVTIFFMNVGARESITGCPACGRTWCD